MATDLQSPPDQQNMTSLVSGIMNDVQELFRQQFRLIRVEMKEDFRKTKEAAYPMAIGFWLAFVGSILLSAALALGLVAGGVPYWLSFAIVGMLLAIGGSVLFVFGKAKFDSFNPLPDQSAEALKENLEWIAKPK